MASVFRGVDTPYFFDSCHSDRTVGRGLGVAKIAVKLEDFVLAVNFLIRRSQGGFSLGMDF